MLKDFYIKNFRLFKSLEIDSLNRVNLIVGKNNVGKSCLLEALLVFVTQADRDTLIKMLSGRDEDVNNLFGRTDFEYQNNHFRSLFYQYTFPDLDETGIRLFTKGYSEDHLEIFLQAFEYIEKENGSKKLVSIKKNEIQQVEKYGIRLMSKYNNRLDTLEYLTSDSSYYLKLKKSIQNSVFLPASGLDNHTISFLWDTVNLTTLEDKVIQFLKIIDKDVEKIALIGDDKSSGMNTRIPVVKLSSSKQRIPLKSFGDGTNYLFQLILCLVNAKDGYLFIDEFGNGLHWSIISKVWKGIITLAEDLNVQVFAATHSRDCINGFHEAWSGGTDSASFMRIDKRGDNYKVTSYSAENLSDALETETEVR